MINSQQTLAAPPHCALPPEELFRRGFISDQRIGSDVAQAIDTLSNSIGGAADEAAAFVGIRFARMREEFLGVRLRESNHRGFRKRDMAWPPDVRKGFAFPFTED